VYALVVLALALLIALETPQIAFVSDEQQCAGEPIVNEVAYFAGARVSTSVKDAAVVVLAPSAAQLALDRAAFMKLMHAQLDAVRAVAPRAWIVMAAPSTVGLWLNAVVHKRGDGALSFVLLPKAIVTRDDCSTRAVAIAEEVQVHASPGTSPGAPRRAP
jgi:hypothetical protein